MKVVILAGGLGTRLGDLTEVRPKPMVKIGNKPILWHIMQSYASYGYNDFIIALGYKAEFIKEYFLNARIHDADFRINLATGNIDFIQKEQNDWNVSLIDTGLTTMTGGRLKKLKKYIGNETFMLTYGDGLSNVNINDLVKFHIKNKKLVTVTAVRPNARFGELNLNGNLVTSFEEKPQLQNGWINGGFFVIEPEFIDLIDGDETLLEKEPLERAANMNQLVAYKHEDFWQCMDTKRDLETLENLWNNMPPWQKNQQK